MRVACFVSGSGTNAKKIIDRSLKDDSAYQVVLIFTDVKDDRVRKSGKKICNALDIARGYGLDYECEDIRDFYKKKGRKSRRDLSFRPEYDKRVVCKISPYNIDLIALAGYMSIVTKPLLDAYNGRILNVHPADLSIMKDKERKYVGIHVVGDAILGGENELRSSTHIVREKVDHGEILVISEPLSVALPEGITLDELYDNKELFKSVINEHQDRLKEQGDWVIYPLTLQMIAEGVFSLDGKGGVYLDGKKLKNGFRL
jgi:folate-dependent phosphoribosylglycinamide formyltransferase PurN